MCSVQVSSVAGQQYANSEGIETYLTDATIYLLTMDVPVGRISLQGFEVAAIAVITSECAVI